LRHFFSLSEAIILTEAQARRDDFSEFFVQNVSKEALIHVASAGKTRRNSTKKRSLLGSK